MSLSSRHIIALQVIPRQSSVILFYCADDVVTIFEKILGFFRFCSPCNGAGAVWGILPDIEKMLGFVRFFN